MCGNIATENAAPGAQAGLRPTEFRGLARGMRVAMSCAWKQYADLGGKTAGKGRAR